MSRCFRYLSDFARNGASSDPLIPFIKGDEKKSKTKKKERRAEKRKRKAELSNCGENPSNKKPKLEAGLDNNIKPDDRRPKKEAVLVPVSENGNEPRSKRRRTNGEETPSIVPPKSAVRQPKNPRLTLPNTIHFRKVEESELLEKSALTEETELPIHLPNFTSSSANSQLLRKRIQPVSPVSAKPPGGGSINKIRIRMQSQPEKAVDSGTHICSTSGRVVGPVEGHPKKPAPGPTTVVRSVHEETRTRLDPVYEALLVGCLPPLVPPDTEGDDWLFGCHREKVVEKVNEIAGCYQPSDGGHIRWPRARYLPEGCVYVMPYVVPY